MDLQQLRSEIDSVDDQIIRLFRQRMEVSAKIAAYKAEHNLPIYVPQREQEKLQDVAQKAGTEMDGYMRALYRTLFELSRNYQKDISIVRERLSNQNINIALIGMPGCGKTTIASALAKEMHKDFLDTDEWICSKTGISIPEIFRTHGESYFREIESQALACCQEQQGLIIATGGGSVTQSRNYWPLKQNCLILWLQRDLDKLPTLGRPLSESTNLYDLYEQRKSMYALYCDAIIDNNGTPDETVHAITDYIKNTFC